MPLIQRKVRYCHEFLASNFHVALDLIRKMLQSDQNFTKIVLSHLKKLEIQLDQKELILSFKVALIKAVHQPS